ncbi:MAG: hypothetical protein ACWA5W_07155 [Phycisphaerales bacterium]
MRKYTVIHFNLRTCTSTAGALLVGSALLLAAPSAFAQSSDLPRSTVEAISINASQRSQVEQFIESWKERALSDDAQDRNKALEALTKPLQGRGVSVAFRQSYTQAIAPLMNAYDEDGSIGATLASLRIAGELATPSTVGRVRNAMNSDDLGVQIFAVSRAGRIFSSTINQGPAITDADANSLIESINTIASDLSADANLLGASIRALSIAAMLPSNDMGDARSNAVIALANAVGPRLRALDVHDDPSNVQHLALQAAGAMIASISDISSDVNQQATRQAVGLGGDMISIALRRVLGGTINPVSRRELTVQSVQAGESLLYFARRNDADLKGTSANSIQETHFAQQLADGKDKAFRNDSSSLLGPGSDVVTRFNFNNERFLR